VHKDFRHGRLFLSVSPSRDKNKRAMLNGLTSETKKKMLAGFLAGSILVSTAIAQSPRREETDAAAQTSPRVTPTSPQKTSPYRSAGVSNRQKNYNQIRWGVDSLSTKAVESGLMIRFSYRVLDAQKAMELNDKKATPFLLDETAHVKLVVPSLEKVGQLRQRSTPEVGKAYWMIFSNKEKYVKPGHRVSVVIGKFHVDGLVVQ
jgi:hypothetical protein